MTPAETIDRLEAVRDRMLGLPALFDNDELAAIESALAALRESQSAREKAAREAAQVVSELVYPELARICKAAIFKHFNLEAK